MFYERWDYDVAVAYAFVTLTTIGFGDYVAGKQIYNNYCWLDHMFKHYTKSKHKLGGANVLKSSH